MIPEPITLNGRAGTVVYLDALWHPVTPEQATMARVLFDDGGSAFYMAESVQSNAPGVGGITQKFDESKHPRGEDGRFKEATQPRIFNKPSDVGQYNSWGETKWGWLPTQEEIEKFGYTPGKPTGRLLTGEPLTREQLPETLYHVTTNAPAVESSGVLLGLQEMGGLGGGQAEGVSFTTSKEDAVVIQRELMRSVWIARGQVDQDIFSTWAKADERSAGLPEGSLQYAADQALQTWESNKFSIEHTYVPGQGYTGPPHPPEEYERLRRSILKDAFNSYLWARETAAEKATGGKVPLLKNPIIFGQQEHLARLDPANVQILEVPSAQIPAEALVTTGSDKFLHEVRAYSDVPIIQRKKKAKDALFDESKHPRTFDEGKEGQFTETGHAGIVSDPVLAKQAKDGIAAVEKLLPEAIKSADFSHTQIGDVQAHSWKDVDPVAQKEGYERYMDKGDDLTPEQRQKRQLRWEQMPDDEKFMMLDYYQVWAKPVDRDWSQYQPAHWVTGVETGEHSNEDYARTHAIATKLTELRTDELREERGLLDPDPITAKKPTYTIEPQKNMFLIKDETGQIVGSSNTMEDAQSNAEDWAIQEQKSRIRGSGRTITSAALIEDVWDQWKRSSSDGLSLSLQLAAARELGGHHRMEPHEVEYAENEAINHGGMATLQAYVRAQWEVSQTIMHKAGEDKIDVYRALMLPGDQLKTTPKVYTDKLGQPIAPPSNIQTGIDKNTQSPYVSYDFNNSHFVVIKERARPKSILEIGPQSWHDVPAEQKNEVIALWQADAAEFALGEPKTQKLFEHLGDANRLQLMQDYITKGRMTGRVVPIRPYETDEEAIQRRMARYESDQQYTGNPEIVAKLPALQLKRAGAQSTTGTRQVANDWGGVGDLPPNPERVVLRIEAPATSVLSLPVYGENEQAEHETVILGTKDHWLWDAWHRIAPDFASQSIAYKADMKPLVIDLQAEDRGKPHWMSTVDWSKSPVVKWDEQQHPRDDTGKFTEGVGHEAKTTQPDAGAGSSGGDAVPASPGKGRPTAVPEAETVANAYNAQHGFSPLRHGYVTVDDARAGDIADAYEALPVDDNANPEVRAAYSALSQEIQAQWDHITASGVTFEPWTKEGQPYQTSQEMVDDVKANQHLYFFTGGEVHPLLGEIDPKTGLSMNDKFRAVHDYFGHAAGGYGFGARGEENAWISHSQMLTPQARRALTTETRGQNSWVNFGRQNYDAEGNHKNIPPQDRPFATQKTALLPEQWALLPGETSLKWDAQQPRDEEGRWVETESIKTERPMVLAKGAQAIMSHYAAGRMPLDADKVATLEKVIQSGKTLPPLVMSPEGILRDGHHRLQAYRNRGVKVVRVVDESALKWDESQHPRDDEGQFTRVAMTSQRLPGDPGHMPNKDVFQHMRDFHEQLSAIPGVSNVSVKPGVGGWNGGSESMWQIYYKGNGEARKLVAKTAKAFNQDSVLLLNKCYGKDCQPAVELSFEQGISPTIRERIHQTLVNHGITGWTWMKRNGKSVLRMVCVPQWGDDAKMHQRATAVVSQQLREVYGLKNHRRVHPVAVSVMEREGVHSYDTVIGS